MLPKVSFETHVTELPVTKMKIKFRPYRASEEKLIWMAKKSDDPKDMPKTLMDILSNCVLDKDVVIKNLPMIDVQWLCIQIRMKSFSDEITESYMCENDTNDGPCSTPFELKIKCEEVALNGPMAGQSERKIKLTDELGMVVRYPSFKLLDVDVDASPYDPKFIREYIECVYTNDDVYQMADQSEQEVEEFISSLPLDAMEKIKKWIEGVPSFSVKKEHKCVKCGYVHEMEVNDLENFFR